MSRSNRATRAVAILTLCASVIAVPTGRCVAAGHEPPIPVVEPGAPSLTSVLARCVEAGGGEEAFAGLSSRVMTGRMVTDLPTWDPPVYEVDSLMVWSDGGGAFLIASGTGGGAVLEGYDGASAWRRDEAGKIVAVDAVDEGDAWLTDPRFPLRLDEHFPNMVYLGVALLDGRRYDVVDIDERLDHRLYFDEESGLLSRIGYNCRILSYAEVDGVLVPVEVEYSRKGGSTTFVIESVVHNAPVDARLFARPGSY